MRSLESQNIQRLDSKARTKTESKSVHKSLNPSQHKSELKKLNHSILVSYLELLDVLVKAPGPSGNLAEKSLLDQKLYDIEVLFKNMHHLINELRPHQARDALICIMESQKQERIELAAKFRRHLEQCVEVLGNCIRSLDNGYRHDAELKQMLNTVNGLGRSVESVTTTTTATSTSTTNQYAKLNGFRHDPTSDEQKLCREMSTVSVAVIESKSSQAQANSVPCDFKDQVLCDLIDEYLIKEF